MEPGFKNLDHARAEQLLARDRNGEIRAPNDGLVMLPLYQGQGDDGFFWGRAVSAARLRASEALRHLRLDRFLDLLPGVARDKSDPSRFIVDLSIARIYPLGVFHMLGYRRIRSRANELTVERQPEDQARGSSRPANYAPGPKPTPAGGRSPRDRAAGSVTRNVLPRFGADSKVSSPPISATRR